MRWFFLVLAFLVVATVHALGPRGAKFASPPIEIFPDMDRQDRLGFQRQSHFFEDGRGGREPVEGTVPIGYIFPHEGVEGELATALDFPRGDSYLETGRFGDYFGKGFPAELVMDEEFIARGMERYQIVCTVCHGTSGNGMGIVSRYWAMPPTANLLDQRVVDMPEGQIYNTITHGQGLMGAYKGSLSVRDRWAIIAYVRALQAAQAE